MPHRSLASCDVSLAQLMFVVGHIMTSFHHNLMWIGLLCDHDYRALFKNKAVTVFSQDGNVLLRNWRKKVGAKLWVLSLCPKGHSKLPTALASGPTALNAHNLTSITALVKYLHICAGFPV